MRLINGDLLEQRLRFYCEKCDSYGGVRCRACDIGTALDLIEHGKADATNALATELFQYIQCSLCPVNETCYSSGRSCEENLALWLKGVVKDD